MQQPPANPPSGRWSGALVIVCLLAIGITYWVVNAQAQRRAISGLQRQLVTARDEARAAQALADERQRELERLRDEVEALTGELEEARAGGE